MKNRQPSLGEAYAIELRIQALEGDISPASKKDRSVSTPNDVVADVPQTQSRFKSFDYKMFEGMMDVFGDERAMFWNFVDGFLDDTSRKIELAKDLALEQRLAELQKLAHSLIGISGQFGAASLAKRSRTIETNLRSILEAPSATGAWTPKKLLRSIDSLKQDYAMTAAWIASLKKKDGGRDNIQNSDA